LDIDRALAGDSTIISGFPIVGLSRGLLVDCLWVDAQVDAALDSGALIDVDVGVG
jgi:hypothetical protein